MDQAICGVGVLPADERMRDVMHAQDGLYTLVLKHPDGSLEGRVIGSVVEYLFAPYDAEAVIERLAARTTRIVSLTITEGGYNIADATGEFDVGNASILDDLRPGAVPRSVFGLVTEALVRRRRRGDQPFTVMSCDNLPGNGRLARRAFAAFAALRDPELGEWVGTSVAFPDSMVDRITPVTSDEDRRLVRERFGVDDLWPVVAEPFTQWVLQDRFPLGRPPLERVGVQLVDDVEPYELLKLRVLNGSHQALAYLGYLAGHRYVHEAAQDEVFAAFLRRYMEREAAPTLPPVPGVDVAGYGATVRDRFANSQVRDTLARICAESSDRIPKFVLPVVRAQLRAGREIGCSALVVAAWARYAEGVDETGAPVEVVDRDREAVMARARRARHDPAAFLEDERVFGDLARDERFVEAFAAALRALSRDGARATVARLG
jgi:mannitol 2-dehydrogenase